MVRARRGAVNQVIAQANAPVVPPPGGPPAQAGGIIAAAGGGAAPGPPPVPNVIAVQPPGLPPLTPLEQAFVGIGFSEDAARVLTSPNDQNITLPSLALMDDAEVKTLCATMRKPGGGEQGTNVATRAEVSLKTVCYMARHYRRTSRVMTPQDLTFDNVVTFANHRKSEVEYKEPTERLKLVKVDKMLDFIEEWPEQLALFNGQGGRPLSYVIRDDVIPPEAATDPPFGDEASTYGSMRDEIQARAPHGTHAYRVDNAAVFEMLNTAISEHKNVKTWIKSFAVRKDGRAAWMAFKSHYRGTNQLEAIEAKAEKLLQTLVYRGEKPRYNFEIHISKHLQAHLDIEKSGGEIIETKKVRYLIESIQAPFLNAATATVRATDRYLESFDLTTTYMRTFIIANEHTEQRTVASVSGSKRVRFDGKTRFNEKQHPAKRQRTGRKRGGSKVRYPTTGLDRFYKPDEWKALSPEKKAEIMALRKKRNSGVSSTTVEWDAATRAPGILRSATVSSIQTTQR
jgi:hypothetical protein